MKKVVKFGGSSLADSEQFKKVGEIIKSDPSRVYVIPSAPGKRFSGDEKVTDLLYMMHAKASKDEDFGEELDKIKEITIDSSLNDPATLPKPIQQKLFDKAIADGKFSEEDLKAYEEAHGDWEELERLKERLRRLVEKV